MFEFKQFEEDEDMFLQIDGESVKVKNIKSITISKGVMLDTCKMKVLIHPDLE